MSYTTYHSTGTGAASSSGSTFTITSDSVTSGTIHVDAPTVTTTGAIIYGTPEQPVPPQDYSYRDEHYDDDWGKWK